MVLNKDKKIMIMKSNCTWEYFSLCLINIGSYIDEKDREKPLLTFLRNK